MLIMEGNMVYEIDEDCIRREDPPEDCGVKQELDKHRRGIVPEKNGKRREERVMR